jgi:chromosome segregation ATPase
MAPVAAEERTRLREEELRAVIERIEELRAERQSLDAEYESIRKELETIRAAAAQTRASDWEKRYDRARAGAESAKSQLKELRGRIKMVLDLSAEDPTPNV